MSHIVGYVAEVVDDVDAANESDASIKDRQLAMQPAQTIATDAARRDFWAIDQHLCAVGDQRCAKAAQE
jgi:hypothetical protein